MKYIQIYLPLRGGPYARSRISQIEGVAALFSEQPLVDIPAQPLSALVRLPVINI